MVSKAVANRGSKRAAAAVSDATEQRRAARKLQQPSSSCLPSSSPEGGESALIACIVAALDEASDLSTTGRGMLTRMANDCLGTPVGCRHEFQAAAAEMLSDVLSGVASSMDRALVVALGEEEEARARRAARGEDLNRAQVAVTASSDALEAAQEGFSEINQGLDEEREALNKLKRAREVLDAKAAEAEEWKGKLETVVREHYPSFMLGADESSLNTHLLAITPMLSCTRIEESLLRAFSKASRVKPAARGTFDRAVLEQVEATFRKQAQHFGAVIESHPQEVATSDEGLADARERLQQAQGRQASSSNNLRSADVGVWEAEGARATATDRLREADAMLSAAVAARLAIEQQLKAFRAGPLAAIEVLCPQQSEPVLGNPSAAQVTKTPPVPAEGTQERRGEETGSGKASN